MKQSLQPRFLLSLGSALCTGSSQVGNISKEFQPKVSSSSNHCPQLPQATAETKEHLPRNNSQLFPADCSQAFQKRSLPSCPHHQLLNLATKLAFSLREGERSQRPQLAAHKRHMAGENRPIASSSSSVQSATPCFLPPKKCTGHFDIISL